MMDLSAIAAHAESIENQPDPRDAWKGQTGFNVVSLGDWISLCGSLGIPHVPAERVATVDVDVLMRFEETPPPPELEKFYEAVAAAGRPNTMLRWDVCATESVKYHLGTGRPEWVSSHAKLPIDDPRAFDLIYEYPDTKISAWSRPWMEAKIVAGYPIEYRSFVRDGVVIGISNYYPQRDLILGKTATTHDLDVAIQYSRRLAEKLPLPIRLPGGPFGHWPPYGVDFTADFMVLAGGTVVFLEGGPAYGAGAHPCCFPPTAEQEWREHADTAREDVPIVLAAKWDACERQQ